MELDLETLQSLDRDRSSQRLYDSAKEFLGEGLRR